MYLAIDGVIGVGKTSLVRLLQPAFGAQVLLEVFEENPFLSDFYSDRARYAFQTQIFFLLSRYHQQRAAPALLKQGPLIADYTFTKDALVSLGQSASSLIQDQFTNLGTNVIIVLPASSQVAGVATGAPSGSSAARKMAEENRSAKRKLTRSPRASAWCA